MAGPDRITPYIDGLVLTADGGIAYAGETILSADDVATVRAAESIAAAERDRKRTERYAAQHAAAPDADSHAFRHRWSCDACVALRAAEHAAYVAQLAAAHDAGEHAAVTGGWCPWGCPRRENAR
jgi:hypothetical protein